jgi:hypothetical protein
MIQPELTIAPQPGKRVRGRGGKGRKGRARMPASTLHKRKAEKETLSRCGIPKHVTLFFAVFKMKQDARLQVLSFVNKYVQIPVEALGFFSSPSRPE